MFLIPTFSLHFSSSPITSIHSRRLLFKTIPGAGQAASLESLEGTTISFSLSKGNQIHKYVQFLAASTKNPKLKEIYSSCAENYDDFIGNLQNGQGCSRARTTTASRRWRPPP
ncbi:hypothetical protein SAY87_023813 [Trapa incisa]|uniref:Uncharacterized protein n=1 Tax=Trapa incisa TaxID=236973 RepID=A0AAN7L7E5_9MYRT|nr:hypothetical protein SAY87_023813 [Trapa incisa]